MKKLTAVVLVAVVGLGITAAPAEARDSSWGCGGACRVHR